MSSTSTPSSLTGPSTSSVPIVPAGPGTTLSLSPHGTIPSAQMDPNEYVLYTMEQLSTPTPEPPPVAPPPIRPMIVLCGCRYPTFSRVTVHEKCHGPPRYMSWAALNQYYLNMEDRWDSEGGIVNFDYVYDLDILHSTFHVSRHTHPETAHISDWRILESRIHALMVACYPQAEQVSSLVRDAPSDARFTRSGHRYY